MAKQIDQEIEYYYDTHPTEEDLMGESSFHADTVDYLVLVLRWLFRGQLCAIYKNLNFYQTRNRREYPLVPDIAVLKGVAQAKVISWKIWRTGMVPQVVFEILSGETWDKDLTEKPQKYAQLGVEEYFAYDPHVPPVVQDRSHRLFGWQLDKARGEMVELVPDAEGRLWSNQLDSWLVPDGDYLRLYDRNNQRRLTQTEAEVAAREAADKRVELEARRANAEARRANAEARRADAEARKREALAEKLRSLGINPDEI